MNLCLHISSVNNSISNNANRNKNFMSYVYGFLYKYNTYMNCIYESHDIEKKRLVKLKRYSGFPKKINLNIIFFI